MSGGLHKGVVHRVMEHAKNESGGNATEAALAALATKVGSMT